MVASWAKGKFFLMWWHDSLGRTCDYSKILGSIIIYVPNFAVLLIGLWGNWWLTRERRCSLNSLLPWNMGFVLLSYTAAHELSTVMLSSVEIRYPYMQSLVCFCWQVIIWVCVRWPIQSSPHRITRWFKWGLFETNPWFLISMQFGMTWFTAFLTFILHHFFFFPCLQS